MISMVSLERGTQEEAGSTDYCRILHRLQTNAPQPPLKRQAHIFLCKVSGLVSGVYFGVEVYQCGIIGAAEAYHLLYPITLD